MCGFISIPLWGLYIDFHSSFHFLVQPKPNPKSNLNLTSTHTLPLNLSLHAQIARWSCEMSSPPKNVLTLMFKNLTTPYLPELTRFISALPQWFNRQDVCSLTQQWVFFGGTQITRFWKVSSTASPQQPRQEIACWYKCSSSVEFYLVWQSLFQWANRHRRSIRTGLDLHGKDQYHCKHLRYPVLLLARMAAEKKLCRVVYVKADRFWDRQQQRFVCDTTDSISVERQV